MVLLSVQDTNHVKINIQMLNGVRFVWNWQEQNQFIANKLTYKEQKTILQLSAVVFSHPHSVNIKTKAHNNNDNNNNNIIIIIVIISSSTAQCGPRLLDGPLSSLPYPWLLPTNSPPSFWLAKPIHNYFYSSVIFRWYNIWQQTTKNTYDMCCMNHVKTVTIQNSYWNILHPHILSQ